jgi:hypothetical protein
MVLGKIVGTQGRGNSVLWEPGQLQDGKLEKLLNSRVLVSNTSVFLSVGSTVFPGLAHLG